MVYTSVINTQTFQITFLHDFSFYQKTIFICIIDSLVIRQRSEDLKPFFKPFKAAKHNSRDPKMLNLFLNYFLDRGRVVYRGYCEKKTKCRQIPAIIRSPQQPPLIVRQHWPDVELELWLEPDAEVVETTFGFPK